MATMMASDDDNRGKQAVVGSVILLLLAVAAGTVVMGCHFIPGVFGEWLEVMVGIMTSPVFLEISAFTIGLLVVLAINHWRAQKDGDELVVVNEDGSVDRGSVELPRKVAAVQAPEKELRFTRSGQALGFWLVAAWLLAVAVILIASALYRGENPALPHPAWALLPVGMAFICLRIAVRLTRHAYLILTPIGVEIFPFFRPAQGMHLVMWQEIAEAEIDARYTRMTLHYNAEKTSGIHLSLRPVRADRRELLACAVLGRITQTNN